MRGCSLPIFTAKETITNLTQYKLFQAEWDLLKAGLYFSIQLNKIQKSEIITDFEKIHRSFFLFYPTDPKNQNFEKMKRKKKKKINWIYHHFTQVYQKS